MPDGTPTSVESPPHHSDIEPARAMPSAAHAWFCAWMPQCEHLPALLVPGFAAPLTLRRQADIILHRVRVVAWLAAGLTAGWSVADMALLPASVAADLVVARLVAAALFVVVAAAIRIGAEPWTATAALAAVMVIPTAFFMYADRCLNGVAADGVSETLVTTYHLFPFVVVTGISLFPVTALGGVALLAPIVVARAVHELVLDDPVVWLRHASELWLLLLISTVAIVASVNQLHLLLSLVRNAAHDRVSGAFTRAVGEELLQIYVSQAARGDAPLSVALLDLDRFKRVNDDFGHDAGDAVLRAIGRWLGDALRRGDILIRWGGDEFLLVLPAADAEHARQAIARLWRADRVVLPDGCEQTMSIGLAERRSDGVDGWQELVRIADERAYKAKRNGRNRLVDPAGELTPGAAAA